MQIWLVGLGGFVGAIMRYGVGRWVGQGDGGAFPLGTFLVNLSGCFLLGLLIALSESLHPRIDNVRLFVGTGILGAYTTFSAFSMETIQLWRAGHPVTGSLYVLASLAGGLIAAALGYGLAKLFVKTGT